MAESLPRVDTPVRVTDAGGQNYCRVEEIDLKAMLLAVNEEGVRRVPNKGAPMSVHWSSARAQFEVPVKFEASESRGHLELWRFKVDGDVREVQRRRFVRVFLEAPVGLRSRGGEEYPRRGMLMDLSEGGARCTFPPHQVSLGEDVELILDLDGEVVAPGAVLRVRRQHAGRDEVVITFDVTPQIADRIRKYVFAVQLAARRQRRD